MKFRVDLYGIVQGVGCRFYCAQVARRMKIHGSASNERDGSVKILIETRNREEALEYAETLRINRFGFGFWGSIRSVEVSEFKGVISGDYTF